MDFIDNLLGELGITEISPLPFRAALYGGKLGYFENIKGIKTFSKTEIEAFLAKGTIIIKGENLFIKKYCLKDLVVLGEINSVEVVK